MIKPHKKVSCVKLLYASLPSGSLQRCSNYTPGVKVSPVVGIDSSAEVNLGKSLNDIFFLTPRPILIKPQRDVLHKARPKLSKVFDFM